LIAHQIAIGVREVVLERIDGGGIRRDREVMSQFTHQLAEDLQWCHEAPHQEPLLWISDAVLSAYGAGGDWRRLAQPMISVVLTGDD